MGVNGGRANSRHDLSSGYLVLSHEVNCKLSSVDNPLIVYIGAE